MLGSEDNRAADKRSEMRPHEEFVELCAVSTSGELSEEEQKRLQDHLATCAECRQALMEFESAAEIGVPLLHSKLSASASSESQKSFDELIERTTPGSLAQLDGTRSRLKPGDRRNGLFFAHRNGRGRAQVNWNHVWMSAAAAVMLSVALGMYAFQFGKRSGQEIARGIRKTADARVQALEQEISDSDHERQVLLSDLAGRDRIATSLRNRLVHQMVFLNEIKEAQVDLEHSLQNESAEKEQMAERRASLSQQLDAAQASLQKMQTELDSVAHERDQDRSRADSLEAQIKDLRGELAERAQTISKDEELLAHDRDIRELMGARELYIAEVYDVAGTGQTNKPYGRVFFTKGKSLVFYAYDLDKQPGVKNVSTFQVWGQRGPDKEHALNLGIFYEDSAAKKRWTLKFDDPVTLAKIDAVFVTVEPTGGSREPSGKRLLFASLRQEANHP